MREPGSKHSLRHGFLAFREITTTEIWRHFYENVHYRCDVGAGDCAGTCDIGSRQEKAKSHADTEFLTNVVPGIAASVRIIEYEVTNTSDEKVKDFAVRVLKQHTESIKTASGHAKRLNVVVDADGDLESKQMLDKLSKLKGAELDVAFLNWLSEIHRDTTVFDNEVKNGLDVDLKSYAKNSITAGNEHLKEAREFLAKMKK